MIKLKKLVFALIINTIDANGNKYSVSFSIKGLPEALMDFAERCGPKFQQFSGIRIKNIEVTDVLFKI